jgi:hypothetical protein
MQEKATRNCGRVEGSQSPADAGADHARDSASSELWLERSVVGLLRLLTDSLWTGWAIFTRPHRLPIDWMNGAARPAPPFSFLIVSLLAVGIAIRLALLYFNRPVDESLLSRLGETLGSLAIKDVFLLTVPCVVLVKMTGAGVARWTRPQKRFEQNPIVAWITYAAGFQCLAIAGLCAGNLSAKILSHKETVLPAQYEDEAVVIAGSLILLLSATLVYAAIRATGSTAITRSRMASGVLSLLTVCTTLIGVLIVNSISFNVESTIGEVLRYQQQANLGENRVAIRTIDSRILEEVMGEPVVEVTVAMMNVSDETVAVPRPRELECYGQPTWPAIEVLHDSLDWTGQAGWILAPGETQLTTWTLRLPDWCEDASQRWNGVSVLLSCTPLNRDVDLAETHPIGDPQLILTTLRLPPFGGSSSVEGSREERVAAEPQSRR